jgi:hypothetical protein
MAWSAAWSHDLVDASEKCCAWPSTTAVVRDVGLPAEVEV